VTSRQTISIILTVLALSAGQILFKLAARNIRTGEPLLQQLVSNAWLYIALAVYGLATIFWIALLRYVSLQLAYPFVALAFFFVPLLAHWILGETLRWQSFAGALLILAGVWVSVGINTQ
jgi:drug/metabolite transporter (DMT)-like permease